MIWLLCAVDWMESGRPVGLPCPFLMDWGIILFVEELRDLFFFRENDIPRYYHAKPGLGEPCLENITISRRFERDKRLDRFKDAFICFCFFYFPDPDAGFGGDRSAYRISEVRISCCFGGLESKLGVCSMIGWLLGRSKGLHRGGLAGGRLVYFRLAF